MWTLLALVQDIPAPDGGWFKFIGQVAFPIAACCAMGYGAWRCARWLAPQIIDLFKTHTLFVETTSASLLRQEESRARQEKMQAEALDISKAIGATLEAMRQNDERSRRIDRDWMAWRARISDKLGIQDTQPTQDF